MLHLLPHWTHPGKEGRAIPIVAYGNTNSVELFLNTLYDRLLFALCQSVEPISNQF